MKNVMIDIECMGTGPTAALTAIGAVLFDETGISETGQFYAPISLASSVEMGMKMDPNTVVWWLQQSEVARMAMIVAARPLVSVLLDLQTWMPKDAEVWGNGATFDNVILRSAYDLCSIKCPWHYRGDRCFRTLKALFPGIQPDSWEEGTHNALVDARNQARHAAKIFATF